ncbi:ComEA family DNA-binding protein [Streptomyces sp. NPDC006296]|uniref:ComEA family DNA-binding protein n=1 Tax=Streptomyces sp. NPDC006296 TaxID=3156746 RepID=UPI0033B787FA
MPVASGRARGAAAAADPCTASPCSDEAGRSRPAPSWAVAPRDRPSSGARPAATPPTEPETLSHGVPGDTGTRPRWWREAGPALRDRLPLWVQSRCGLERRALTALAVVLAGAAVLAGTHFWSARPESVRAPDRVTEAGAVQTDGTGSPSAPAPGPTPGSEAGQTPATPSGGRIVVDVSGKVRRPGIQYLPAGSRVADALQAAGGLREGADVTLLNRARVLTDGEQVAVDTPGAPPPAGGTGTGGVAAGAAGPTATVSLGTATAEQLETLPGVGPVLAQHIIDYRTEHGGFRSVDELREVKGIGDRRFADLRPLVSP